MKTSKWLCLPTIGLIFSSAILSACGSNEKKNNNNNNDNTLPQGNGPGALNGEQTDNSVKELKVLDGQNVAWNQVRAVNVNDSSLNFDFTYEPLLAQSVTLRPMRSVILVGCENKDVGYDFNIFRVGPDGEIDPRGLGLGFTPIPILGGEKYVVRVHLMLAKPCLGISFNFGVAVSH